ncbi:P-loop containing nucleoside triphosphate hydrolase protein [Dendrothele bispora CBS 962.96]|uniref:DNA 3'-5' helicase n=1 Tax=Dendrothele bispora (strain CBS 962.96) TaxID=1314807 RepID=A0A4S8KZK0_DENBC|nr:P-loop containing nucleoside triphosphate hydrolase protein [Dendrothele bispora CBS 962.96]
MPPGALFSSDVGRQTLQNIVKTLIPQWRDGLRTFQLDSIPLILDNQDIFCITATGEGKSALFAIPILVHEEIFKNKISYPEFLAPIRQEPVGIVVTPTKGLSNNIVKELQDQFRITAFAYTRENIAEKARAGLNVDKEIADCQYQIICVDPEHLREPSWIKISDSPKFRKNVIFCCAEEAHVIDEWGLDFRPHFRHIGSFFRGRLPSTKSIFAITATMQPGSPFESVCLSLGFSGPKFHLLRYSNECPNVEISVKLLTTAIGGREFPQLLPYLNQCRKTIIHVRTIELGYRVFLYIFRNAPQTYNRHYRIRMYSALAPDQYNKRTVELLLNDGRCQIVIATKAFSLGIHAKTLQDSISIGTPDTQCELDQSGGRVGRDRNTNARRIVFVTSKEMGEAHKRTRNIATKTRCMDLAKSQFLTEKICRVSRLNKIYANPPIETSFLDCIQAKRRLPCDVCRTRYDLLDTSILTFPPSPHLSKLPPFKIHSDMSQSNKKRGARADKPTKKEADGIRKGLAIYEREVYLEERLRLPHRNIPHSFYFPPEITDLISEEILKIDSIESLTDRLKPIDRIFKSTQAEKLFAYMSTLRLDIEKSRNSKSKYKQVPIISKSSSDAGMYE